MNAHVKSPILHLEVLTVDGTRASDHVVFCQLQRQSVRVEECAGCVHCDSIGQSETPSVECTIPTDALDAVDDPAGDRTEVGRLLCHGTLVVGESVPFGSVLDFLRQSDRRSVAIVDSRHVMIGLVHETSFPSRLAHVRNGAVSAMMTTAIAVDECTPVRSALKLLAASHLREATVLSKRGVPIGVFRDVDGLRWIAASARVR